MNMIPAGTVPDWRQEYERFYKLGGRIRLSGKHRIHFESPPPTEYMEIDTLRDLDKISQILSENISSVGLQGQKQFVNFLRQDPRTEHLFKTKAPTAPSISPASQGIPLKPTDPPKKESGFWDIPAQYKKGQDPREGIVPEGTVDYVTDPEGLLKDIDTGIMDARLSAASGTLGYVSESLKSAGRYAQNVVGEGLGKIGLEEDPLHAVGSEVASLFGKEFPEEGLDTGMGFRIFPKVITSEGEKSVFYAAASPIDKKIAEFQAKIQNPESFWTAQLPAALAGSAVFLVGTAATGIAGGMTMGALLTGEEAFNDIKQREKELGEKLTYERKLLTYTLYAGAGSTEALPAARLLKIISKGVPKNAFYGLAEKKLEELMVKGGRLTKSLLTGASQALEELVQNSVQSVGIDATAKWVLGLERTLLARAKQEGPMALAVGAIMGGGVQAAFGGGRRKLPKGHPLNPIVEPATPEVSEEGLGAVFKRFRDLLSGYQKEVELRPQIASAEDGSLVPASKLEQQFLKETWLYDPALADQSNLTQKQIAQGFDVKDPVTGVVEEVTPEQIKMYIKLGETYRKYRDKRFKDDLGEGTEIGDPRKLVNSKHIWERVHRLLDVKPEEFVGSDTQLTRLSSLVEKLEMNTLYERYRPTKKSIAEKEEGEELYTEGDRLRETISELERQRRKIIKDIKDTTVEMNEQEKDYQEYKSGIRSVTEGKKLKEELESIDEELAGLLEKKSDNEHLSMRQGKSDLALTTGMTQEWRTSELPAIFIDSNISSADEIVYKVPLFTESIRQIQEKSMMPGEKADLEKFVVEAQKVKQSERQLTQWAHSMADKYSFHNRLSLKYTDPEIYRKSASKAVDELVRILGLDPYAIDYDPSVITRNEPHTVADRPHVVNPFRGPKWNNQGQWFYDENYLHALVENIYQFDDFNLRIEKIKRPSTRDLKEWQEGLRVSFRNIIDTIRGHWSGKASIRGFFDPSILEDHPEGPTRVIDVYSTQHVPLSSKKYENDAKHGVTVFNRRLDDHKIETGKRRRGDQTEYEKRRKSLQKDIDKGMEERQNIETKIKALAEKKPKATYQPKTFQRKIDVLERKRDALTKKIEEELNRKKQLGRYGVKEKKAASPRGRFPQDEINNQVIPLIDKYPLHIWGTSARIFRSVKSDLGKGETKDPYYSYDPVNVDPWPFVIERTLKRELKAINKQVKNGENLSKEEQELVGEEEEQRSRNDLNRYIAFRQDRILLNTLLKTKTKDVINGRLKDLVDDLESRIRRLSEGQDLSDPSVRIKAIKSLLEATNRSIKSLESTRNKDVFETKMQENNQWYNSSIVSINQDPKLSEQERLSALDDLSTEIEDRNQKAQDAYDVDEGVSPSLNGIFKRFPHLEKVYALMKAQSTILIDDPLGKIVIAQRDSNGRVKVPNRIVKELEDTNKPYFHEGTRDKHRFNSILPSRGYSTIAEQEAYLSRLILQKYPNIDNKRLKELVSQTLEAFQNAEKKYIKGLKGTRPYTIGESIAVGFNSFGMKRNWEKFSRELDLNKPFNADAIHTINEIPNLRQRDAVTVAKSILYVFKGLNPSQLELFTRFLFASDEYHWTNLKDRNVEASFFVYKETVNGVETEVTNRLAAALAYDSLSKKVDNDTMVRDAVIRYYRMKAAYIGDYKLSVIKIDARYEIKHLDSVFYVPHYTLERTMTAFGNKHKDMLQSKAKGRVHVRDLNPAEFYKRHGGGQLVTNPVEVLARFFRSLLEKTTMNNIITKLIEDYGLIEQYTTETRAVEPKAGSEEEARNEMEKQNVKIVKAVPLKTAENRYRNFPKELNPNNFGEFKLRVGENGNLFVDDGLALTMTKKVLKDSQLASKLSGEDVATVVTGQGVKVVLLPKHIIEGLSAVADTAPNLYPYFPQAKPILELSTQFIKSYLLLAPTTVISVQLRNLLSDIQLLVRNNPDAFYYLKQASQEILEFSKTGIPTPMLGKYLSFFPTTGIQVELQRENFAEILTHASQDDSVGLQIMRGTGKWVKKLSGYEHMYNFRQLREMWFRYASFLSRGVQRQENMKKFGMMAYGKNIKQIQDQNYGAANPNFILGLTDPWLKDYYMANSDVGDYNLPHPFTRVAREHMLPFVTWFDVILRNLLNSVNNVTRVNSIDDLILQQNQTRDWVRDLMKNPKAHAILFGKGEYKNKEEVNKFLKLVLKKTDSRDLRKEFEGKNFRDIRWAYNILRHSFRAYLAVTVVQLAVEMWNLATLGDEDESFFQGWENPNFGSKEWGSRWKRARLQQEGSPGNVIVLNNKKYNSDGTRTVRQFDNYNPWETVFTLVPFFGDDILPQLNFWSRLYPQLNQDERDVAFALEIRNSFEDQTELNLMNRLWHTTIHEGKRTGGAAASYISPWYMSVYSAVTSKETFPSIMEGRFAKRRQILGSTTAGQIIFPFIKLLGGNKIAEEYMSSVLETKGYRGSRKSVEVQDFPTEQKDYTLWYPSKGEGRSKWKLVGDEFVRLFSVSIDSVKAGSTVNIEKSGYYRYMDRLREIGLLSGRGLKPELDPKRHIMNFFKAWNLADTDHERHNATKYLTAFMIDEWNKPMSEGSSDTRMSDYIQKATDKLLGTGGGKRISRKDIPRLLDGTGDRTLLKELSDNPQWNEFMSSLRRIHLNYILDKVIDYVWNLNPDMALISGREGVTPAERDKIIAFQHRTRTMVSPRVREGDLHVPQSLREQWKMLNEEEKMMRRTALSWWWNTFAKSFKPIIEWPGVPNDKREYRILRRAVDDAWGDTVVGRIVPGGTIEREEGDLITKHYLGLKERLYSKTFGGK